MNLLRSLVGRDILPSDPTGLELPAGLGDVVNPPYVLNAMEKPEAQPRKEKIRPERQRSADLLELLGVHGRTRDILGAIGDVANRSIGQRPWYAERQQQDAFGEAMQGYDASPMEAIQRAAASGASPDVIRQMINDFEDNRRQGAELAVQTQTAEDRHRAARDEYDQNTLQTIIAMAARGSEDPNVWGALRPQIERYAQGRNYTLPFELPGSWSEDWAEGLNRQGMTAKDATNLDNTEAYRRETLEDRDADREVRRETSRNADADRDASRSETVRHNRTAEGLTQTRDTNRDARARERSLPRFNRPGKPRVVRDANGRIQIR